MWIVTVAFSPRTTKLIYSKFGREHIGVAHVHSARDIYYFSNLTVRAPLSGESYSAFSCSAPPGWSELPPGSTRPNPPGRLKMQTTAVAAPTSASTPRCRAAEATPPHATLAIAPPPAKPHVQRKTESAMTPSVCPICRPRFSSAVVAARPTKAETK